MMSAMGIKPKNNRVFEPNHEIADRDAKGLFARNTLYVTME